MQKSVKVYTDTTEEFSVTYDLHTDLIAFSMSGTEYKEAFQDDEINQETLQNILKGFFNLIKNTSDKLQ